MPDEDKTREQLIIELHELRQRLAESEKALRESERRLTEVQRIGKIGDWEWIPAENKVIWSAEMYAIFGIDPETVSLTTEMCIQAFHPEDRAVVSEATLKTLQEHKPQLIECRILKPDGTISYVHGRGEALLDANGKLVKMVGIYQNITERSRAEEALRQSEELLRVTLANILDPVFITDNDGKFTFICPNVPHILGYSVEELQTMGTISKLVGDGLFSSEELERLGEIANIERLIVDNYGRQRVFLMTVKRVSIGEGTRLYAIHDITERKKAEISLQESEVRFRELFNHMSSGVAVYEAIDNGGDFIFRDFNPAAEKIEKVSKKDILGKCVSDAFPGVKAYGVFEVFQRVWQTGKSEYFPDNIYKDERNPGSWRESWVLKLPTDEIVAVYNDITERKRAEEALRESEKRHRQISDLIGDYAYSCLKPVGGPFVIDWLVGAVEKITGYSLEEIRSHGCWGFFVHPVDLPIFEKNVIGLSAGETSDCELRIVCKDGSTRWIRASSKAVEDSRNPLSNRLFGSCEDITKRKEIEEAVVESNRFLTKIINAIADPVFVKDRQHRWILLNDSLCSFMGYSRGELVGKSDYDFFPVGEADVFWQTDEEVFTSGIENENEEQFTDAKGVTHTIVTKKSQHLNASGEPVLVGVIRDITERKQAEDALRKSEERHRQSQKLEAIGTLAGGIAHDFNNILGIIMGYTELAKAKCQENENPEQYTKEVLKACRRAKDLIRQILSFSHGGDKLEQQVLYVLPIIKEVIKFLKASLPSSIQIQQSIASETGIVFADPTQVYQVLTNLCTNAAHAMEEAGGILGVGLADVDLDPVTLPLRSGLKPGPYVRLTVADTGHGMDAATLERIFDPYFTTKGPGKGSGLGLAVVHGIVKGHNGGITVSSERGKGTTFHVYLPRIESELTTSEEKSSSPVPTGTERILVVDDEAGLVDIWKRHLELLGYVVVTKTSCLEALELFRVHPDYFDLVISDYTMPHMNGIHLAREMMRIQPNIPIIICTGWRERIRDEMNRETGVRAFLMKPLELRTTAEAIRKVLDEK